MSWSGSRLEFLTSLTNLDYNFRSVSLSLSCNRTQINLELWRECFVRPEIVLLERFILLRVALFAFMWGDYCRLIVMR